MTPRITRSATTVLALALSLTGVAGCSSDDVAEQLAENAAGEGSDVSIDSETGDIEVQTEDGSASFSTTELPADWPSEVPLPADYELESAFQTGADGQLGFTLGGTIDDDPAGAFDQLVADFAAADWQELENDTFTVDGNTSSSANFDNGTWLAIVSINSDGAFSMGLMPSGS